MIWSNDNVFSNGLCGPVETLCRHWLGNDDVMSIVVGVRAVRLRSRLAGHTMLMVRHRS